MVLTKEKLIFIHIPKTGGVSVEEFLHSYYGYKRNAYLFNHGYGIYRDKNNDKFTVYPHMHFPLKHVVRELNNNNIVVDDSWTIFSIVRNPYHKFLSAMLYDETSSFKYHYFSLPANQREYCLNKYLDEFINSDINLNYHSNHSLPQYKFFEGIDLPYKIFKLEDKLDNALMSLGFDAEGKVKHYLNTFSYIGVKRPDYKEMYTDYFIEYINDTYKKDFEIYNYPLM